MSIFRSVITAIAASLAFPSFADTAIHISDAYARSSGGFSRSGAAFMVIENTGSESDRLIAAHSDVAERVELHTHLQDTSGVMRMIEVEDGFEIPAGGSHALQRGGDHIMFMGISEPFAHGEVIPVTLVFEQAGEINVGIPVNLERSPFRRMHQHGG